VAHLQDIHRELHHPQAVEVRVHDEVGDVAVDEQLAGQQPDDVVRGHPAVGTADPQILGRLLLRQFREKGGVLLTNAGGPGLVAVEEMAEGAHA